MTHHISSVISETVHDPGSTMSSRPSVHIADTVKVPNHTILYGMVLTTVGVLVVLGALTRLYELREFFPFRLPDQINEFILNYIPFIVGTFVTSVAALAGTIVGLSWIFSGLGHVGRIRVTHGGAGNFYRPSATSLAVKEGKIDSYKKPPTALFWLLGIIWKNTKYLSEISRHIVKWNARFVWKMLALGIVIHFAFRGLEFLPPYLASIGLGTGYVLPSPVPFYNLLIAACICKALISLSLVPFKKPVVGREMDSMIVEGTGHPSVFFAVLEEGSKIFAKRGFPNRISRSRPYVCDDGETLLGTLIESFPEYVKTTCKPSALICLLVGSVMMLVGFLQIVLMQYPTFSVGYEDFFRLYSFNLVVDIVLNIALIILGKGFLDQAKALMSIYRFRSNVVYVEAKGDLDQKVVADLSGIVAPERLFNPTIQCAFNVRYFSAEAISESVTPDGIRELVALETSGRLAKDVAKLKFLPFQIRFSERYPSVWRTDESAGDDDVDEQVVAEEETSFKIGEQGEDSRASVGDRA